MPVNVFDLLSEEEGKYYKDRAVEMRKGEQRTFLFHGEMDDESIEGFVKQLNLVRKERLRYGEALLFIKSNFCYEHTFIRVRVPPSWISAELKDTD